MMALLKCLSFLGLLFLSFNAQAQRQSKQVYQHKVFWSKIEVNDFFGSTKKNWGYGFDFVYRTKNEFNTGSIFKEHLREGYRPWVHYQFSNNSRFSVSPLGYMYTTEYVGKQQDLFRQPYHELRTTFQYFNHLYSGNNNKFMHTFRYRYELRWQHNPEHDNYRYLNRFRFRYRVRYLINKSSFYANNLIYLNLSNEVGLNFGSNVPYMFNQNRFYGGVGYRFANAARFEVRFVNRHRGRGATGFEYDNDEGLMLSLYIDKLSKLNFGSNKNIAPVRYYD